jgi:hypothetical protein
MAVNDTSSVIRMTATAGGIIYDHHSDDCKGVVYGHNILIIQATVLVISLGELMTLGA